jgi:F0F1-type ATP synthase epsilon subunit
MLLLAGCTAGSGMLGSDLRLITFDDTAQAATLPLKPTVDDVAMTGSSKIVPAKARPARSAWCDYLREDTMAQTTVMRSPSLSGSINDSANASVSLGLSANSFLKASLLEEAAELKCQKHVAETGLQKLVFVSKDSLTASGHRARFKAVTIQKAEIARLRRKAAVLLSNGIMDQEEATQVNVLADAILASGENSRSETERRLEDVLSTRQSAAAHGSALLQAETELEDINSRMRTIDAFDVSATVGWNDDVNADGLEIHDQSFNGKISFSMKLGALNPRRFAHEEAAKAAKLHAITNEEGGAIWQVETLRRALGKALGGLQQEQESINAAIAKVEKLAGMLADEANPEFEPPLVLAKLQLIKLRADRAAVAGSISEIQTNMKRLKTG